MVPPASAPPAILAYLTLANKLSVSWDAVHYMKPPSAIPPCLAPNTSSREWDAEWMRAFHLADTSKQLGAAFSGAFIPGSLEGVWEGLFTVRHLHAAHAVIHSEQNTGPLAVHRVYDIRGPPLRRAANGPSTQPCCAPPALVEVAGTPPLRLGQPRCACACARGPACAPGEPAAGIHPERHPALGDLGRRLSEGARARGAGDLQELGERAAGARGAARAARRRVRHGRGTYLAVWVHERRIELTSLDVR